MMARIARIDALAGEQWTRPGARLGRPAAAAGGSDTTELLIYGPIGGWWGDETEALVRQISSISTPRIRVRIHSGGGDAFDGMAIRSALVQHPADVEVHVDGIAASAASIIVTAGDTVAMAPGAMIMIHCSSCYCYGAAQDHMSAAALLSKVDLSMSQIYSARAGRGAPAEWLAAMEAETWYTAEEAIAAGLADEISETDDPDIPLPDPYEPPPPPVEGDPGDGCGKKSKPDMRLVPPLPRSRYSSRSEAPDPWIPDPPGRPELSVALPISAKDVAALIRDAAAPRTRR